MIAPASEPIRRATAITIAAATANMISTRNMSCSRLRGLRGRSVTAPILAGGPRPDLRDGARLLPLGLEVDDHMRDRQVDVAPRAVDHAAFEPAGALRRMG
jgi:hypothetical protein